VVTLVVGLVAVLGPLATGCASDARPPFAEECIDDPRCSGDGGTNTHSTGSVNDPLECLSQEELERRTELYDLTPMTGTPNQFRDGTFNFMDTDPIDAPARIITMAEGGGGLACTDWDGRTPFTLHGAEKGSGPVRIEPLNEGDFVPTVLESVRRSGASPYLPVFPIGLTDQIFEDIGVERRLDRAQIMTVVASGTQPSGRYIPRPGVIVKSVAAQTVAFKQGSAWTTEREDTATDGDGLALLVNANGYPTVEGRAVVTLEGSITDEWELISSDGAVTYALIVATGASN
jgi:hypothetical protein